MLCDRSPPPDLDVGDLAFSVVGRHERRDLGMTQEVRELFSR